MLDTLRLVSSEDVGRDEANVQSLLKKHKEVFLTYILFRYIFIYVIIDFQNYSTNVSSNNLVTLNINHLFSKS